MSVADQMPNNSRKKSEIVANRKMRHRLIEKEANNENFSCGSQKKKTVDQESYYCLFCGEMYTELSETWIHCSECKKGCI